MNIDLNENHSVVHHSQKLGIEHIRHAIHSYPHLPLPKRDVIIKWQKKIKVLDVPEFMPYDDLYSMTIGLPTGIFSYQFDLTTILHFLQQEGISPISLDTSMMISHVDESVWNEHPDTTPYPIVVLETPLIPKGYLLTGHKTILDAKNNGKNKVQVYVLSEMEYVPLMFDDISKAIYSFHRDLQNLLSTPITPPMNSLFLSHIDTILVDSKEKR